MNNGGQVCAVSFVMEIREMDNPMSWFAFAQPNAPELEPFGLEPLGIANRQKRCAQQRRQEKPTPSEHFVLHAEPKSQ